ncbi:helix-turn-helix transcriptional regulator [Nocardia ninae]|uniref:Transcriptional regulator n=1 Tax=Nocardia ninae NBRC 108245 TaxID=1210091 RepID=A0A511MKJ4_9NOCA|nr:helix-turn-helix transcriptional regulator [Nocardia ninae]GEM41154.1 transcriptional regulator [Nocardia ninae NBRC 108245]
MNAEQRLEHIEPISTRESTNIGDVPTVLRRMLGLRLQQLRKELGLTQHEVGRQLYRTGSKVSRIESGMVGLNRLDVVELLNCYGVTDPEEHDRYLSLVQLGNRPGWWHSDSDSLPKGFELLSLEAAARTIRCYEPAVVPDLLQTPEYARAALCLRNPARPVHEIDKQLEVRLQRQQILHRDNPPYLWILVEESALRRQIGGIAVWRAQLEYLARCIQKENIVIQIVDQTAFGPAIMDSAFVYLRFAETLLPDVVCISQPTSTLYMEGQDNIVRYLDIAETLARHSARQSETPRLLQALLETA